MTITKDITAVDLPVGRRSLLTKAATVAAGVRSCRVA